MNAARPGRPRVETLFRSESLEIQEFACPGGGATDAREQASHRHEIVLPRSGVFLRRDAGGTTVADPTVALHFEPQRAFDVVHPAHEPDVSSVFALSRAGLEDLLDGASPRRPGTRLLGLEAQRMHRELLAGLRAGADALEVEEQAAALLVAVLGSETPSGRRPPLKRATLAAHADTVARARVALATRFREKLTLRQLAREVYSSPYHLCRIFRRETGLSICDYRERLRVVAALEALAQGAPSLSALAHELGFAHHSHLTRAFRAALGEPPSSFRRRRLAPRALSGARRSLLTRPR